MHVPERRLLARPHAQVQHAPPGGSAWRAAAFRLLVSERCEMAVMAAIGANVAVLALTHADMTPAWQAFMSTSNAVFTAVFTLEAAAKLAVLGPRSYLRVRAHARAHAACSTLPAPPAASCSAPRR